jgi:hypothetical protein
MMRLRLSLLRTNDHKQISIYIETSVRNKCRWSFYCALLTLHVLAPIVGHLQVVCNTKNSKAVTVCQRIRCVSMLICKLDINI